MKKNKSENPRREFIRRGLLAGAGALAAGNLLTSCEDSKSGEKLKLLTPDGKLVEICELADHPWMVSCQFHPEFGSRPTRPHPLFRDFIGAAKDALREGDQTPLPFTP